MPSSSVTVTQTSIPSESVRSIRLAGDPWTYSVSPLRAWIVGMTNGRPSWTKPTWQMRASSRIASIVSRSYAPRSGWRRTDVAVVGRDTPTTYAFRRASDPVQHSCPVLRRLRIENLVLIREAELDFAPGLNAITGETGAGKTILAGALGLLLGARGEASLIGPGGDETYVEAELDAEPTGTLAELKPSDEDAVVPARRIFADGRTRAYAWGRAASREDVADAMEQAVAMSGQFQQRRLARPSFQLDVLDAFAGAAELRGRLRSAWRELTVARRRH